MHYGADVIRQLIETGRRYGRTHDWGSVNANVVLCDHCTEMLKALPCLMDGCQLRSRNVGWV